MAADSVSKSGIWIDTKTGKLVESQPEEGVQMVPAGGTIDPTTAAQLDAIRDADKPKANAPAANAPTAVTTADVAPQRRR